MITATNTTQNNLECSPDEIKQHYDLAKAAILAELIRWTSKNQALRRQPRKEAVNLLTSRYVFTWKRSNDGSRYMKCRLAVHGFKDTAASSLERFSGTSTRWGQRAVVATAVQNQWPMASLDVSEAFLKGFTFEEIQERRGGPKREVSPILPRAKPGEPSGVAILRTITGYESFHALTEVLETWKGGLWLARCAKPLHQ